MEVVSWYSSSANKWGEGKEKGRRREGEGMKTIYSGRKASAPEAMSWYSSSVEWGEGKGKG